MAYALPPGFHWLEILAAHAHSGASFLPIDVRLSLAEQDRVIERARPAVLVRPGEEIVLAEASAVDPEGAWAVVATSGASGEPKLAQSADGGGRRGRRHARSTCSMRQRTTPGSRASLRRISAGCWCICAACSPARRSRCSSGSSRAVLLAEAPQGAHVSLVPTMLERLVRGGADLGSLGELLVGGGPLDPTLRDAAVRLGARVVNHVRQHRDVRRRRLRRHDRSTTPTFGSRRRQASTRGLSRSRGRR